MVEAYTCFDRPVQDVLCRFVFIYENKFKFALWAENFPDNFSLSTKHVRYWALVGVSLFAALGFLLYGGR